MPSELVETTPTQLMSGFGLPIGNLLSHLCDEALRVQGYVPKGLLHEVDAVSGTCDVLRIYLFYLLCAGNVQCA